MIPPTQLKILHALSIGPAVLSELAAQTGASTTTVSHSLRAMVTEGTVTRSPTGYRLTGIGRATLAIQAGYDARQEILRNPFWAGHDLSGIPDHLLARIGELEQYELVGETVEDHFHCLQYFLGEMSKAKELCGVSPHVIPDYIFLIDGLIELGSKVSLVLTTPVIGAIGHAVIRRWLDSGVQLYDIPAATVAFAVTEKMLSLGLYGLRGQYDPLTDLDCMGESSIRWGRDLYRHYRKIAKRL